MRLTQDLRASGDGSKRQAALFPTYVNPADSLVS